MPISKPLILKSREEAPREAKVLDIFLSGLEELFFVLNPRFKKSMQEAKIPLKNFLDENKDKMEDVWIYFPWKNKVLRLLPEDLYFKLRTSRNRNIITKEEQERYRNSKVGIAGLSVGSAALHALVISGGPRVLKIADFDALEVTNLNRIRAGVLDVGVNKTEIAGRQVWELDPFSDLYLYENGISAENMEEFILGGENSPKLDIFIDEMDSLDIKTRSRFVCRENGIPCLMATDNGDGIILDVERFDLEPGRPIFHGLVGDLDEKNLKNIDFKQWLSLATKIVGPDYLTERMQDSLLEIGRTIAAVPQLGSTASIAGSAVAFAVRRIANNQDMPSGRYIFSLEEKMIPNYSDPAEIEKRKQKTKDFLNKFGGK